ncbi:MAG: low molecular weight protein arginine phosphatase [Acidobacteria bacterium]|nr:MAG: low molecular weight protein arginine phosphatase [Acidobacteriota bacterium]
MPRVLFVCTANICRSPVAAAILRHLLEGRGYRGWQVASGGTLAMPGLEATPHSIEVLAERGLDLGEHRAQRVEAEDVKRADLVLCMESGHAEALRIENPGERRKIFLLTEMIGRHENVADPYGGPKEWYEIMADQLSELIERGLPRIVELAQANAARRVPAAPPTS